MPWIILTIPISSLFMLLAFALDEREKEKIKAKKEEEYQKKKKEFVEKYLTKH